MFAFEFKGAFKAFVLLSKVTSSIFSVTMCCSYMSSMLPDGKVPGRTKAICSAFNVICPP